MKIKYLPNIGFQIDSEKFDWNKDRFSVRKKLQDRHKVDDKIFEMSKFFGGDKSRDIEQRRDIYQNINKGNNYFFLSYDKDDKLSALEVHWGIEVLVKEILLKFERDLSDYLKEIESTGESYSELEEGNYLFPNLKMTIANSESMGGDGNGLSYFYGALNIDHLI